MGKVLRVHAGDEIRVGAVRVLLLRTGRAATLNVIAPADHKIELVRPSNPPTLPFRPEGPQTGLDAAA